MNTFDIRLSQKYSDLPLRDFDHLNRSVYVIDFDWIYLYVNDFVAKHLVDGGQSQSLVGRYVWESTNLRQDSVFNRIKNRIERKIIVNETIISPLTLQPVVITGLPLQDCYFFFSSPVPQDKADLLSELRQELARSNATSERE